MKLLRTASAGTIESSDCLATVSPADSTEIAYNGANSVIFAKRTKKLINGVLEENNISAAKVTVQDQGAIEITIKARLRTAIARASMDARAAGEVRQ